MEAINLHFIDYLVFAILLTLLYGITSFEYYSGMNQKSLTNQKSIDLRKAATWTFFGILLTVIGGIVAELNLSQWAGYCPLLVPFSFLFIWAGFHRRASSIIDMRLFETDVNELYKTKIRELLEKNDNQNMNVKDLYDTMGLSVVLINEVMEKAFSNQRRFYFSVTKNNVLEVIRPLMPTMENIEKNLVEMDQEGIIIYNRPDKTVTLRKTG
jgi:hypothetical protein